MTRLALLLAAPVLFPGLHPAAVWIGCACIASLAWVWWRADDTLGDCERGIRAQEASDVLAMMSERRIC